MDDQWSYFFSTATDSEEVSPPIHEEVSPPIHEDLMVSSTSTDSEEVSSPIHENLMVPSNDPRDGDGCDYFEFQFFEKKSADEVLQSIVHPSHPHRLALEENPDTFCSLCGKDIVDLSYNCIFCYDFQIDIYCGKYSPPEVIDNPENHPHDHQLTLIKRRIEFECDKCGKAGDQFSYRCRDCEIIDTCEIIFPREILFHMDCVWHPSEIKHPLEINHSYHPMHPLKLIMGRLPDYSDGKCRICGSEVDDRLCYHCSSCNFTLDMRCVLQPPLAKSLLNLKAHEHQLTLLPRLDSFTCNACGLKGDRSPYVCFQCGFMVHQKCLDLPRIININRHDHRVSRTSVVGIVNSVCGVCRKKVDWIFGGYSCVKCPSYAVHSKCATRDDVWNGKELEGVPEKIEDIKPYVIIDENTIQHFSHKEHYLKFHVNGVLFEENKRCNACIYPIGFQSFYGCYDCHFILHQNCAEFPLKKRHVLYNQQLTLYPRQGVTFRCSGCSTYYSGFMYEYEFDYGGMNLDVRCASISEPFVHPSHQHPLYHTANNEGEICNGCNLKKYNVLKCIEDGCEYILGFKCATLPQVIKHRVDDHALSLCYGEDEASGKYWCDICEKETNPKTWFYTSKDQLASLHVKCIFGDFSRLMPGIVKVWWGSREVSFEAVLNDSMSRPFCEMCESRCMHPIMLKMLGTSGTYICSDDCAYRFSYA